MRGFAILDLRFAIQAMGATLLGLLAIAFLLSPARRKSKKSQTSNLKWYERFKVCLAPIAEESRLHNRGRTDASAWHRRQHSHFQSSECSPAQAIACAATATIGAVRQGRLGWFYSQLSGRELDFVFV